ncbi:Eukaryotic translation initiation factor 3 subunit H, partial [Kappamyces sp. JEL0680]
GVLTITNSFAIPPPPVDTSPAPVAIESGDGTSVAVEEEQTLQDYEDKMIELLGGANYETNAVGWYQTYTSILPTDEIIEDQFAHQKENPHGTGHSADPIAIHIMYQPTRTQFQSPSFTAVRLSKEFMAFYSKKSFVGKSVKEHGISYENIFEVIPITVKNSFLLQAALANLDVTGAMAEKSLFDANVLSSEKLVEKKLEALIDTVEDQGQEVWRWQTWHRGYQKEQQKIAAHVAKLTMENEASVAKGGEPLHSDTVISNASTSVGLGKSIAGEPGRLDTLLLSHQIDLLSQQLQSFAA